MPKPIELPPAVVRRFVDDMRAFHAEPNAIKQNEIAALVELANAFEPIQDGRIYIEKINGPFLFELKGTPAEYKAGLDFAVAKGWFWLRDGTYVRLTEAGAQLFA